MQMDPKRKQISYLQKLASAKFRSIPPEVVNSMKSANGNFQVIGLPTIQQAEKMSHKELLRLLQFCPASDYFGRVEQDSEGTISLAKARKLTADMIRKANMQLIDAIPELESAQERDSQSVAGYDLQNNQANDMNR